MPRKPGKAPSYCLHKASGQAVVRIDGVDRYLGLYGSEKSHELYERAIAEWRGKLKNLAAQASYRVGPNRVVGTLTVEQVLALFWQFAKGYYTRGGIPTGELANLKYAIRPVRKLYGSSPVRDFGPLALKAIRQHLIDADICRTEVNARINRIKRVFKWATSEQLLPPGIYEELRTVAGLSYGRTEARESKPVKPVADDLVEAVLPFVSLEVRCMIRLQRLTGMRPCEVVQLRMCDIDVTRAIWVFEPRDHKNRWRGHTRLIPLGPKAQKLMSPFIQANPANYLFSPTTAEERRNVQRRQLRTTPMTPSQTKRKAKKKPKRAKRDRYDVNSYRRAITYGIKKAALHGVKIAHWRPNQLRHSRATEVRKLHGIEAAQVSLGHARTDTTEIYAERNLELALAIAEQTG